MAQSDELRHELVRPHCLWLRHLWSVAWLPSGGPTHLHTEGPALSSRGPAPVSCRESCEFPMVNCLTAAWCFSFFLSQVLGRKDNLKAFNRRFYTLAHTRSYFKQTIDNFTLFTLFTIYELAKLKADPFLKIILINIYNFDLYCLPISMV